MQERLRPDIELHQLTYGILCVCVCVHQWTCEEKDEEQMNKSFFYSTAETQKPDF